MRRAAADAARRSPPDRGLRNAHERDLPPAGGRFFSFAGTHHRPGRVPAPLHPARRGHPRRLSRRHDLARTPARPKAEGCPRLLRRGPQHSVVGGAVQHRGERDERAHVHLDSGPRLARQPRLPRDRRGLHPGAHRGRLPAAAPLFRGRAGHRVRVARDALWPEGTAIHEHRLHGHPRRGRLGARLRDRHSDRVDPWGRGAAPVPHAGVDSRPRHPHGDLHLQGRDAGRRVDGAGAGGGVRARWPLRRGAARSGRRRWLDCDPRSRRRGGQAHRARLVVLAHQAAHGVGGPAGRWHAGDGEPRRRPADRAASALIPFAERRATSADRIGVRGLRAIHTLPDGGRRPLGLLWRARVRGAGSGLPDLHRRTDAAGTDRPDRGRHPRGHDEHARGHHQCPRGGDDARHLPADDQA